MFLVRWEGAGWPRGFAGLDHPGPPTLTGKSGELGQTGVILLPVAEKRTNEEWLAQLRAGDADALEALRGRLEAGLRSSLSGRAGANEVEDLAQDGLLKILDRLDSFRGDSRFLTWAMSVALRQAFTTLRKAHWKDKSLDGLELPPREAPSGEEPLAQAEREDLVTALRRAIDTHLTDRQRTLILAELAGMPSARIVEELGTNPNALYKLYHDARKKLRQALIERGFSEEDVRSLHTEAS